MLDYYRLMLVSIHVLFIKTFALIPNIFQSTSDKLKFIEAFKDFSVNHGCMKGFSSKTKQKVRDHNIHIYVSLYWGLMKDIAVNHY